MNLYMPRRTALAAAGLWAVLAMATAAHAADALNGKSLYLNGPVSGGTACASCHGPTPAANVNGILAAANTPSVISAAFAANRGGMGALFNGKFTAAEIADLAAFIGNPNVTAVPAATLAPTSLSFGGVTVGQNSAALSTTLSNTGNAALNVSSIGLGGANAADFSITGGSCAAGGSLAAGANCTVQLVFRPAAAGTRTGALNFGHNATGGSSSVTLSGTGNAAPQATVAVSANSLDFGALLTNTASPVQTLTVTNSGQAALSFSSIALSGANAAVFALGGSCAVGTPVAAGASCTVTVRATPTAAGAVTASLNLVSNASNANVAVALAGTASAAAPALAANPTAVAFGQQTVGAAAVTQNVVITNRGNVPLTFTSVAVTGAASVSIGSGACSGNLAVGASCTVPLSFAPTTEGNVTATLVLRSNAPELSVAVSGTGTSAAVARPALSENGPVAFADTQVGQQAAAHRITLNNSGNAALMISSLVLSGANQGDFALGGSCAANATVSPGASCAIDVSFQPTAAGARSTDLMLVTNGGAQFTVRLNGNGVAVPAPVPALSVNPQAFDFGSATMGGTAPLKRFTLTNSGSAPLVLNSASFSGPFALASGETNACGPFPLTLAAGASCELPVRFTPTTAGNASGNLALAATGGNWTVALSGQGAAAANPGNAPMQNYGGGGCSAAKDGNDPTLALLAVLAAGVLLWRRRQARAAAAVMAAAAALAAAAPAQALEPGKPAPAFTLNGPDGSVKLQQYQGKLVYVDFWASWCGPCRQSFPWMNEMQERYGGKGLQIVGINVDARTEDAHSFLAATPARFVIAFDPSGTAPRSYGIKGMPSSVLIGPDGKVLYEHSGFRPADRQELESRIKLALGAVK